MSDLDGATTPGDYNAYPGSPSEFAARWNSWSEAERGLWLDRRVLDAQSLAAVEREVVRWNGNWHTNGGPCGPMLRIAGHLEHEPVDARSGEGE